MTIARRWHVYAIFSPETGKPVYVGRTYGDVYARLNQHYRGGNQTLTAALRTWSLSGLTPHVEILEKGDGDCRAAEIKWIKTLTDWGHALWNRSKGGETTHLLPGPSHMIQGIGDNAARMARRRYELALYNGSRRVTYAR